MESPQDNDTMPLKPHFNFTPIFKGVRCRMRVAPTYILALRGPGYRGTITDLDTGIEYHVFGKACTLQSCWCDAEVRETSVRRERPTPQRPATPGRDETPETPEQKEN